jgi:hypothetical protein
MHKETVADLKQLARNYNKFTYKFYKNSYRKESINCDNNTMTTVSQIDVDIEGNIIHTSNFSDEDQNKKRRTAVANSVLAGLLNQVCRDAGQR